MRELWILLALLIALTGSLFSQSDSSKPADPAPAQSTSGTTSTTPPEHSVMAVDSSQLTVIQGKPPIYPSPAMKQGIQGRVSVRLIIDEGGNVVTATPVSGNPTLASAAVDAMKHWKFAPYLQDGKPVQISTEKSIDFAFTQKIRNEASDGGGNPVELASGAAQTLLRHKVAPVYPAAARQARIEGTVVLQAIIGKDGTIRDLIAVSSPSKDLTEAAIGAVQQWRYDPMTLNGQPVEIKTTINVNFHLRYQ